MGNKMNSNIHAIEENITHDFKLSDKYEEHKMNGFIDAGKAEGNIDIFSQSADNIVNDYLNSQISKGKNNQEKKNQIEKEISRIESERIKNEKKILRLETDQIEQINERISSFESEIVNIKADPDNLLEQDKITATTSMILLIGLIFLMIPIYSSAIYSAFFRTFEFSETSLGNSIFYSQTYEAAFNGGIISFLITITSPLLFMLFGFVFHIMWEKKNHVALIAVLIFTFLFDALIAFHISKNIFELNRLKSFSVDEKFLISSVIYDENFWLLIFFGFGSYLFLGILYNIFSSEHNKSAKIKRLVIQKRKTIELEIAKKERIFQEINELKETNDSITVKLAELCIEKDEKVIDVKELKNICGAYSLGWMSYLENVNKTDEIILINTSIQSIFKKYQPEEK